MGVRISPRAPISLLILIFQTVIVFSLKESDQGRLTELVNCAPLLRDAAETPRGFESLAYLHIQAS